MQEIHYEILDKERKELLPVLGRFKSRFYLAGGTALALQIAHRDSIDFDFFTAEDFNSEELLREAKDVFTGRSIEVVQAGNKTLNIEINGEIKASFFCIKEKLIKQPLDTEYLIIASIDDIACMKIVALLRAVLKDYVDLYYIFKQKSLFEILDNCKIKYEGFDEMVYLKALTSFNDINLAEILFKPGKKVELEAIKKDFEIRVKQYLARIK